MSFSDIFKSSFLEEFSSADVTTGGALLSLLVTSLFGIYLFFLYRFVTRRTFCSRSFNVSIPLTALITTAIILTIRSSLVVSLGMVGALSIVRFRTAVKDPMDLVFLYWSISVGIIVGAGLPGIALIATAVISIALVVFELLPVSKAPVLLVVNADSRASESAITAAIRTNTSSFTVKSRTINAETSGAGRLDLIAELRTKDGASLLAAVAAVDGVTHCSLMNHDGEVTY